ncbi:peptide-methionine (S)-S-oxide reductase MsrA [Curvibacter sp. PAE-UM]|uniref:peptide-methionine (S)-S-oxide reductase MsrA n=1 Tax=Curvibacter sp. PAE-UM TaxID=1714344 RepID=UPI00070C2B90|nr:peptide-methionine (S)-S-oxide reductase MsrA [Curvibacter sp. PAE-UM]KRH98462.1 peptide methionine sulfoxide reductase [Curvibacter sp. PAE-UM]
MSNDPPILVLGGGCFWCTEAVFDRVRGVLDVESGYSNGHVQQPSYEQVCSGHTGHNEVVRLVYDPAQVSVRQLLGIFFATHDPTTPNRQGNDVGTQYRSAIYTTRPEQEQAARELIAELEQAKLFGAPIVTEVLPLANYWPAEAYHQDYYQQHPDQGYCAYVVGPKVAKFRKQFSELLKPEVGA